MIVAIDGPAGSGKSTTARRVADRLGYVYIDTGAMYRAVALAFLRQDGRPEPEVAAALMPEVHIDLGYDEAGAMHVHLNGENVTKEVRTARVSAMASKVSSLRPVREKLIAEQRRLAKIHEAEHGGVVLDGRDIGTVVFPEAEVKIFMVAEAEVRARRRKTELDAEGKAVSFDEILDEIRQRDRQDQNRALSPLRQAGDAIELDTTHCAIAEQVQRIVDYVRERAEPS